MECDVPRSGASSSVVSRFLRFRLARVQNLTTKDQPFFVRPRLSGSHSNNCSSLASAATETRPVGQTDRKTQIGPRIVRAAQQRQMGLGDHFAKIEDAVELVVDFFDSGPVLWNCDGFLGDRDFGN